MSGDAVRTALEAAREALQVAIQEWHGAAPCDPEARDYAARTVEAFLPKAQEAYAAHYGSPSPQIAWLIAALAAAKETPDE